MPHFGLNQVDVQKIVVLASRTTSGCELISVPGVTKTQGPYSVHQGDLAHVARWAPLLLGACKGNGGQNGRDIPAVPEANTGIVLIPFFGAILLFSAYRLFRAKADCTES